jgi:carboxyl-terminal processing protease
MRGPGRFLVLLAVFVGVSTLLARLDLGHGSFHIDGDPGVAVTADTREPPPEGSDVVEATGELTGLDIVSRAIGFVRNRYVDPKRVDPVKMFVGSVTRLQREVTEVMVRTEGDEKHPDAVVITAGTESRRFDLKGLTDLFKLNWILVDLFQYLRENLPEGSLGGHAEYTAAAGMVRALDPHSTMMTPDQYQEMKVGTYGKFGGLGIVISVRKARLKILSVMGKTPAAEAGLKKGDHIVQINDESTINMGVDEAVNRMRGEAGTRVTVWIVREGAWKAPKPFTLTRATIHVQSVISKRLERDVGYVRIKNFNSNTSAGVRTAIDQMSAPTPLRGVVIDLRGDPGGLLSQAIKVSDLFMKEGVIVTTVGQAGKTREEKKAVPANTYDALPVVVLVDNASASASEIVAGALKYSGRGVIVGERTFGKATVQELYEIAEGALKLTVAQYLTPGDILIQNVGIAPDVALLPVYLGEGKTALYENELERFGEKDLDGALENEQKEASKPLVTLKYVRDEKEDEEPDDYDAIAIDYPIRFSTDFLADAGHVDAGRFLERAQRFLARARADQDARLTTLLAGQGVPWQSAPLVAGPRLDAVLTSEPVGDVLPGSDLTLRLRVTNRGTEAVARLHALLDAKWNLLDHREIAVGAVPPGEAREAIVTIKVPRTLETRLERVTARLYQEYEPIAEPAPQADLVFRAGPAPDFELLVLPGGKSAPLLWDDRDLVFRVRARNTGDGPAESLTLSLKNKSGDRVLLRHGRHSEENVAPGAVVRAEFEVHLNEATFERPLEFVVSAYDSVSGQYASVPFTVAPPDPVQPVEAVEGTVRVTANVPVRVLPDQAAASAGVLSAGAVLRQVGRAGALVGVRLDDDGFTGWLPAASVEPFKEGAPTGYELAAEFAFSPPQVSLDQPLPLRVTEPRLEVTGQAIYRSTFLAAGGDLMAYRADDKVFFQRVAFDGSPASTANFAFFVDLEPGPNRIRLTARVGSQVKRVESFYVYFDGNDDVAATKGEGP